MIKYTPASERTLSLFRTPFEQSLDPNNRWVRMAAVTPWDEMAHVFFQSMSANHGRGSIDLRVVLGALLVKHIEGISDEDTIQYIQENIYAQYFVGLPSFQTKAVFSPTLFVEIRRRLGEAGVVQLNDMVLRQAKALQAIKHRAKPRTKDESGSKGRDSSRDEAVTSSDVSGADQTQAPQSKNKGTLKTDATVAPQHVGYPTDTRLLHEARQSSEELIDVLYYRTGHWHKKPRTYRRKAHQQYLSFAKQRKPGKKKIRKCQGQQLRYLRRNIQHLHQMLDDLEAARKSCPWSHQEWQRFWVIQELYRQQDIMYRDRRRRIDDRIVNIAQAYVRPIVRGKAGKDVEFGAKINVSETEGFVRMDRVDFDNFHEGKGLIDQIEGYKRLYGYYPELVLADQIYLTRANRNYLKTKDIRNVGKPLGRPPKLSKYEKEKRKKEQNKRSHIEGKFGQAKSKYGLDDIKTRREDTSYATIGLILLAINLVKLGRWALYSFFEYSLVASVPFAGQLYRFIFGGTAQSVPRCGLVPQIGPMSMGPPTTF